MDPVASVPGLHAHRTSGLGTWQKVGNFARHFVEMCVPMCLGLAVLDFIYIWAAGLVGYADPFGQLPELSALVVGFNMTAPMVAWMRFRKMDWSKTTEMAAVMAVEAVLIIGVYWLGLVGTAKVSGNTNLWWWQHGLMMPMMLAAMLYRLDFYTGSTSHHAHG
jgi:hypothetical protein